MNPRQGAGVVLGATEGIAPGFEMTLGYRKVELYTEFEYVFDRESRDDNFLYNWSELTYAPVDEDTFYVLAVGASF